MIPTTSAGRFLRGSRPKFASPAAKKSIAMGMKMNKAELTALKRDEEREASLKKNAISLALAEGFSGFHVAPSRLRLPTDIDTPGSLTAADINTVYTLSDATHAGFFTSGGYFGDQNYWFRGHLPRGFLYRKEAHLISSLVGLFCQGAGPGPTSIANIKDGAVGELTANQRGLLLYGAAGVGKSALLNIAAHRGASAPFFADAATQRQLMDEYLKYKDLSRPPGRVPKAFARAARTIVVPMREAHRFAHAVDTWLEPSIVLPGYWDHPLESANMLQGIRRMNGCRRIKLKLDWSHLPHIKLRTRVDQLRTLDDLLQYTLSGMDPILAHFRADPLNRRRLVHMIDPTKDTRWFRVQHQPKSNQDFLSIGFFAVLEELLATDCRVLILCDGIDHLTSRTFFNFAHSFPSWYNHPYLEQINASQLVVVRWLHRMMAGVSSLNECVASTADAPADHSHDAASDRPLRVVDSEVDTAVADALKLVPTLAGLDNPSTPPDVVAAAAVAAHKQQINRRLEKRLIIAATHESGGAKGNTHATYPCDFPLHPMQIKRFSKEEYRAYGSWLYDVTPVDDRRKKYRGSSQGTKEQVLNKMEWHSGRVGRLLMYVAATFQRNTKSLANGLFVPPRRWLLTPWFKQTALYRKYYHKRRTPLAWANSLTASPKTLQRYGGSLLSTDPMADLRKLVADIKPASSMGSPSNQQKK